MLSSAAILLVVSIGLASSSKQPPNIIFLLADDLGIYLYVVYAILSTINPVFTQAFRLTNFIFLNRIVSFYNLLTFRYDYCLWINYNNVDYLLSGFI